MLTIRKPFEQFESDPSPSGQKIVPVYGCLDGSENGEVGVVSEHNLDKEIQSYARETSLKFLIEKFKGTGDLAIFERSRGFFADLTQVPQTFAEWSSLSDQMKARFDELPGEIKEKYDYSMEKLLAALDDGSFQKDFVKKKEDKPDVRSDE